MQWRSKKQSLIFVLVFCAILLFGMLTILRTPKTYSAAENRDLATFAIPSLASFLDGSFQDNLENAMADQFVGSATIRERYNNFLNSLPTVAKEDELCKREYVSLGSTRATFDCDERIVYSPIHFTEMQKAQVEENIAQLDQLNTLAKTYYYVINDPAVFDFRTNKLTENIQEYLKEGLHHGYAGMDGVKFKNYEEAKKIFYKTDHHWNYRGAQQGYLDIAKMLGIKNTYKPTGTYRSGVEYFGSHARNLRNYDFPEEFVAYTYDLPTYKTYVDGEAKTYNGYELVKKHEYKYDKNLDLYGVYYGGDCAEIIFDYNQPEKENLLIIANSYSKAIDKLLAAHFNKTYVIDPRWNKDWRAKEYIKDNKISKIVVILSDKLITTQGLGLGVGMGAEVQYVVQ